MSEKLKRPQQVTLAAVVAGSASLVMLISIADRLSRWNTVDFRESFAETLSKDDLGDRLGVSLDQAMGLARIGTFVAAALATAALVLVVFAARRDKGARIAMSVVAVPLMLSGLLVDPFLAGFVVAGTVLLWSEPARDWYAGRAPRERPGEGPGERTTPPTAQAPPTVQAPPAPDPFRAPPAPTGPPPAGPAPYAGSYGTRRQTVPAPTTTGRPSQVVVGCVTTWLVAGLVTAFTVVSLVGTLVPGTRGEVRDQVTRALADSDQRQAMEQAGITVDQLVTLAQVMLVVVLLWAVLAIALAGFAFAGHGWARVTLVVSAVGAAVLGIIGSFLGALPLLLVSMACVFTVSRLLSAPAAQWYATRSR